MSEVVEVLTPVVIVEVSEAETVVQDVDQVTEISVSEAETTLEEELATSVVEVSNHRGPQGPAGRTTIVRPAGQDLGGHRVVWSDDGAAKYSDAGDVATAAAAIGVTTGAASEGDDATIQTYGPLNEPSWNWAPGEPIYLGAAGQLTQTPPASGAVRQIAIAETATQVFIDLQPEIRRA
jgi:hypothetical protein